MNQILDYNPNKSSGGGKSNSDKIVRVFAAILACFAICLLVAGIYGIYNNNKENSVSIETPTEAKISIEQQEKTILIKVSHDKAIEKLTYSWDSGKESSIKGNGEASMESEIPLIAGTHNLIIKVTDVDGHETSFEKEIESENGEDKVYPVIDLKLDGIKIRVIATDETAMEYVTYRWNDGEEQRVDVSDDEKKIDFTIDVPKGQNDLVVIAVDKNNNSSQSAQSFTGVTEPEIVITIAADKKSANVVCTHEKGIKEITGKINDEEFSVGELDGTQTEVSFPIENIDGDTIITVTAISVEDTKTEITENVTQDSEINVNFEEVEDNQDIIIARMEATSGIKEVKLNINGTDYPIQLDGNPTNDFLEIPLVSGNNKISVIVIDMNDNQKEEIKEITR